jgi:hypothetical protein
MTKLAFGRLLLADFYLSRMADSDPEYVKTQTPFGNLRCYVKSANDWCISRT